ncbi:MAG: PDDEXK nuclease domain-containing protein [Spirochaetia bacterium]|jgi:predicted nuclease of restriction endonuclease-like (RecB) superfamily|nr:PDDEXK nuclease domain-containing protein [Spirochaetia bacterium]
MKPVKIFKNEADYIKLLGEIRINIEKSRHKAQLSANKAMISLYWEIGKKIIAVQKRKGWGSSVVEQLSRDLCSEYSGMKGFSRTNLFAMRQFYSFYSTNFRKVPQPVGLLPWGHIRVILGKVKEVSVSLFYAKETIENGWSRNILTLQIEKKLHSRVGTALTNFDKILPLPDSELAQQTIKDPYLFDFVTIGKDPWERDIELQLTEHITKFLLELGKGFAFVGRQYPITGKLKLL